MTEHHLTHDTMVLERIYTADVGQVFDAWTDPAAKRRWFTGSEVGSDSDDVYELDVRVGGHELARTTTPGGVYTYDAQYRDVVPNERLVYTNHMLRDDVRISVSLTTVEFRRTDAGTLLVLTEHGVYLDDEDKPEYRTKGIDHQLDLLGAQLDTAVLDGSALESRVPENHVPDSPVLDGSV